MFLTEIRVRVRFPVATTDSLTVRWSALPAPGQFLEPIDRAYITATYTGPCPDTGAVPVRHAVVERPVDFTYDVEVQGLEAYSFYQVNVTLQTVNADGTGLNTGTTIGAGT